MQFLKKQQQQKNNKYKKSDGLSLRCVTTQV